MKQMIAVIFLVLNFFSVQAEDDKPTINKMWSRGEGIKNFVFDIQQDSVTFNFSEKDKWLASNIKSYGFVSYKENEAGGRLTVRRDSMGFEHFRVIDIMNLSFDSLKLHLHPEYFAEKEQASNAPAIALTVFKTFYTTEYLYLKKVEEKAPGLKKADYISFLKDAQVEAKKRAAAKTLIFDPKKTIDKRVEEFLFSFVKEKQYRGRIFPSTLERAMKANVKDETINKMLAGIKTNFVLKKATEAEAKKEEKQKKGAAKSTSQTSTNKDKTSNSLIIKTEAKKGN